MNRVLLLVCVVIIFAASLYVFQSPMKSESSDYRFEIIEGRKISVNGGVYILRFFTENCTERGSPYIKKMNNWNLTLDRDFRISNVLKCFGGRVYAAGVDVVKIENGRVVWVKDLVKKEVSYGDRENLIPVEYEDFLNVFDIESDGKFLYFNTRDGVVKTDGDLNVIWAVKLKSESNIRFGDLNDDIFVSDGIYLTKGNKIIKLSKNGKLEWAVSLKSKEKIKREVEILEEKRKITKKEGEKIPEFEELPKYSIELYAVYAGDYVYVAGLAHEHLCELPPEVHPFLAKLSRDGEILWAKIINVTYPGYAFYREGKIIKDGKRFIAWVSNYVLFVFDENGYLTNFYLLKGYISDLDLRDGTIYLACPPVCKEKLENGEVKFEKRMDVEVEKRDSSVIPIDILTEKLKLKVKNVECYSKNWEKKTLIPFG